MEDADAEKTWKEEEEKTAKRKKSHDFNCPAVNIFSRSSINKGTRLLLNTYPPIIANISKTTIRATLYFYGIIRFCANPVKRIFWHL